MDKALIDLIRISNVTGGDSMLAAGVGGNTSVKSDDGKYMYIKASGTALKDMSENQGWRRLNIGCVLEILRDRQIGRLDDFSRERKISERLLRCCEDGLGRGSRPSVESHLHAVLDKYVIHLHPVVVGAYVNSQDGQERLGEIFSDEPAPPLYVPYKNPGYMLATETRRLIDGYEKRYGLVPQILFLEKHGVFVTGGTANETLEVVTRVVDRCGKNLPEIQSGGEILVPGADVIASIGTAIRDVLFKMCKRQKAVIYVKANEVITDFIEKADARELLGAGVLSPDELMNANGPALWVESAETDKISAEIEKHVTKYNMEPLAFIVKGAGLFIAADEGQKELVENVARGAILVRMYAAKLGGIKTLTKLEMEFIND
jgi:rhamnose utilization protein RhaD (predicted bifunctional aldolase and dehydrogenase)